MTAAPPAPAPAGGAAAGRHFHGRRHGKALKPSQRLWLAEDLPRLAIPGVHPRDNPGRAGIDPGVLFGDGRPLWLEIGFGAGEHMVAQATLHPGVGILGAEPFLNGVAMALGRIRRAGVANIRLHAGDVRDLFDVLPAGSVARAFLLYPDPWPKRRHRERRFVTPSYLGPLARVMAAGAELRLASDVPDYVEHAVVAVPAAGLALLTPPGERALPWPGWQPTRYELKAKAAGRPPAYLTFRRG
ncbi:MAG: tRNA (guanosine(46)-N7)-methyltransferase TrmB [Rhodobacteraceae bacterium]|nr:tRNA (guanosine(46)-N7)-methyltransferase TrmB [Paracoccaceae bacterium]